MARRTSYGPNNYTTPGHTLTFPGDFDFHFDLRLQADKPGVYLLSLKLASPGGALAPSEPYYIVLNYGLDESAHDPAIDYVRDVIVPAPATLPLAALAFAATSRRRRATTITA